MEDESTPKLQVSDLILILQVMERATVPVASAKIVLDVMDKIKRIISQASKESG